MRPKDIQWMDPGGMNIAGVEYAEIGDEEDEEDEEGEEGEEGE